jgi:hypothetical protein
MDSPAEDLIRAVWSPYFNSDTIIRILAWFEALAGALLIVNVRPRFVALLLCGYVLGAMVTAILDPISSVKFYALAFTGQYLLKNLLVLSSCFYLMQSDSRKADRKSLRVTGVLLGSRGEIPIVFLDVSSKGLCFLIQDRLGLDLDSDALLLRFSHSVGHAVVVLRCKPTWRIAHWFGGMKYFRVGCRYLDQEAAEEAVREYLSEVPAELLVDRAEIDRAA